jgi:hypothetical protein
MTDAPPPKPYNPFRIDGELPIDYQIRLAREKVAQDAYLRMYRQLESRALRNLIIFDIIVIFIWSLLDRFLPHGWWITVINIVGFLFGVLWVYGAVVSAFERHYSKGLSWFLGVIVWAVLVLGGRTLFLIILGA